MARNSSLATKTQTSSDPIELLEQAEVLRRRAEQSFGEYALEAGRLLIAAKRKIPHGSWASHIAAHTGFSLRTAEVYMRARKRYDQLPASERESVLEQPFTRSLLVLVSNASRPALPDAPVEQAIRRTQATPNGNQPADIASFLQERDIETTKLLDEAVAYTPEPTPFDDIESIVGAPSTPATPQTDEDEDFTPQTPEQIQAEMLEELNARDLEIQRLEREVRQTNAALQGATAALDSAREAALTAVAPASPQRGWDYVANLYQYLKADEPQRTPETLARRAANLPNGREVISYLEMFFTAARTQLNAVS